MNIKDLNVESYETIPYKWKQSANALFNFMKELDFLKLILRNMAIIPRYYPEYIGYFKIKDVKKVTFPMTCFCDIPLSKLYTHIENYGSYGIGLDKGNWGINNGLQPIKYINENSQLLKDFVSSFSAALNEEFDEKADVLKNYIIWIVNTF